jgi:hypothetical protein
MRKLKSIKGHIKEFLAITDYKSVKGVQKDRGYTRKEAEEWLLDNYNDFVEQVNKDEQKEKQENKKQFKEQLNQYKNFDFETVQLRDKTKPRITLNKLDGYVNAWYKKNNKPAFGNLGHFEITLKSRIANIKRTFKFNHINQFNNWIKKLIEDNEIDSAGNTIKENRSHVHFSASSQREFGKRYAYIFNKI